MKWTAALLLALPLLITAGCSKGNFSKKTEGSQTTAGIFRYPIVTNPTTLDPHKVQDGDTIDLLQQVYEGLTVWGEDNKPQPGVAESWTVSDDGRTYTFKLRKGVKFHNGDPVTADDVKWSIERACDPALASATVATYLNDIVGAEAMYTGKAKSVEGVKVIDPETVSITIDKARPYFLGKMTFLCTAVVSKKAAKLGKEISTPAEMVGTGPYKIESYTPEQEVTLVPNPDYYLGAPKIARIVRPVIKDAATRLNKYKAGEIDLVQLERQDVEGLTADPKLKDQIKFFDRPALWYVAMNVRHKPFDDKRVRQAIAMAIDRETIVNERLGGQNKIATGILPPGIPGHRDNAPTLAYDPAKAKQLLAAAGYPNGQGFPSMTMTFREARPDIKIVAEAVASQLKDNLGLDVKLKSEEWRAYLEKHNRKQQVFFHMRWAADYLDAQNFLSLLLAGYGAENKIYYANPQFDALCSEADSNMDEAKRAELYAKAEDIVLDDAPFVPIYFQRDAELISPKVTGLRESLFGHLPHRTVEVK